jgi:hypothetical protein
MGEFKDFLPCGSTVLEDYRLWQVLAAGME